MEQTVTPPIRIHSREVSTAALPAVFAQTVVPGGPAKSAYHFCKRVVDVTVAALALLALAAVLLAVAVLIRLDSPGPVIYRQLRVGCRRRRVGDRSYWEICPFEFYKFRTMYCDADQSLHQQYIQAFCKGEIAEEEGTEKAFKLEGDSRITRLGKFLRRTSLDELPQLVNVLKGEMSLVGPRPVPPYEVAHYRFEHFGRYAALPGISGLWQVRGRGRVPFEEMIRMDIEYAQRCSLWLDVKILLATIPAVIWGHGAK